MNTASCVPRSYLRNLISAIVACGLMAAGSAQAQWSENFDSYTSGSQIHGQGGWKGWDNTPSAGALVSSAFAFNGANSVAIAGGSDLVREYSGFTSGLWTYSMRQYIPASLTTGTSYFILLNTYADGGANNNWSIQTTFNLAANTLTEEMGTSTSPSILRDQWVELAYQIDLTANTVTAFYNGAQFSTHAWQTTGANAIGAVDLFANGAGAVYYDNISLAAVPEPSTIGLLLLGGLAILFKVRKQA